MAFVEAQAGDVSGQAEWRSADGKLLIGHCRACDMPHYYPRRVCPFCFSQDVDRMESAGRGVVYSYSNNPRGPDGPYIIAYVTLDEGVSMLTNIVDADPASLKIGDRVTLAARDGPAGWTPCFRPA